jgi:hypothetical protein
LDEEENFIFLGDFIFLSRKQNSCFLFHKTANNCFKW